MCKRSEFVEFLHEEACRYRMLLEDKFGECDPRFVFGEIKKTNRGFPHTNFPNGFHDSGGCVVDICISEKPWSQCLYGLAGWQLAHESVHLLDPVVNRKSTFLEEGLATWFQDDQRFHSAVVKKYIEKEATYKPSYKEAKKLVRRCMPELTSVIKKIRSSGVRIQDITADELAPSLPNVAEDTIKDLCRIFNPQ